MAYDSRPDTIAHIQRVRQLLEEVMADLQYRSEAHDQSKLQDPEVLLDKEMAKAQAQDADAG